MGSSRLVRQLKNKLVELNTQNWVSISSGDDSTQAAQAFVWPVRVYYEDTDAGQVVYHARYLHFMERARTEWLRAIGIEQDQVREDHQVIFVVTETQLKWLKPARFNDLLWVSVENVRVGKASLSFEQRVWRQSESPKDTLVSATVKAAAVQAKSLKATRIPSQAYEKFVNGSLQTQAPN